MPTCSIHLTDFSHQTDEYLMTRLQNLEIIKAHSSFDNKALLGSEALGKFGQSDAPRNHFKTQGCQFKHLQGTILEPFSGMCEWYESL